MIFAIQTVFTTIWMIFTIDAKKGIPLVAFAINSQAATGRAIRRRSALDFVGAAGRAIGNIFTFSVYSRPVDLTG